MKDSIIAKISNLRPNGGGGGVMMGPSGPFTALNDNLTFVQPEDANGDGSLIMIGQHCGLSGHNGNVEGQACSVQYFLKNMDWSHVPSRMRRVQFGVSGGNPMVPIVTSPDLSLDGYQSLISPLLMASATSLDVRSPPDAGPLPQAAPTAPVG